MKDYGHTGPGNDNLEELYQADSLAFDVETTGLHAALDKPLGVSVAANPNSAYYFNINDNRIRELSSKFVIGHNLKFDMLMLKKVCIEIAPTTFDTIIAAHLTEHTNLDLRTLAAVELGADIITFADIGKSFTGYSLDGMAKFSGAHSVAALLLKQKLEEKMRQFGLMKVFNQVEMPLVPVISEIEAAGVMIDPYVLISLGEEFELKIKELKKQLNTTTGMEVNYNSPQQVAELLFGKLGLPKGRISPKTGVPSTDAEVLKELIGKHPIIPVILEYKEYGKLQSTYVYGLLDSIVGGRVYGRFNQTVTETSRLSSSNPNLQNIPQRKPVGRKIRSAFVAPDGCVLVKVDADQIELREMAHVSQDTALVRAFREGKDIHTETAIKMYKDASRRFDGKTANFEVIYGGGGYKLRNAFFEAYPGVLAWIRTQDKLALEDGYARTMFGRIRVIPELKSGITSVREHGLRMYISTIIQGSSAEIIKQMMVRLRDALSWTNARMVLQVHDEVVFEVPESELDYVVKTIQKVAPYRELSVPFTVSIEVGNNWRDMEKVKE